MFNSAVCMEDSASVLGASWDSWIIASSMGGMGYPQMLRQVTLEGLPLTIGPKDNQHPSNRQVLGLAMVGELASPDGTTARWPVQYRSSQ
ncbi:hypothetical protein RSOLAG22IIIB_11242 [Rhizoctonia solani]|uniref:Uncharacterized protein n=1 Tax=Rhizoctonia solani TaxID=456999 RepID=A0A0K6G7A5_9AGAM|nr:hypothetical protein RSOLAG22IIIB_11242 [Rhizoctonia solani]